MTKRLPATPAAGPLEDYAARFDDLFATLAQRQVFRRYLEGLLLPTERNKTLTALANTEPLVGAQRKEAQGLQWFLSESSWDPQRINRRRVELLLEDPKTAPSRSGALVIDETGDRKDGKKTAHIGKQYLGSIGKIDNGVVSVSSLWAFPRGSTILWRLCPTLPLTTSGKERQIQSFVPSQRSRWSWSSGR